MTYVLNITFSVSRFEVIAFQIIDIETSLNRLSITTHHRINISVRTFANNLANSNRYTNLDAKMRSGTRYGVTSWAAPYDPSLAADKKYRQLTSACWPAMSADNVGRVSASAPHVLSSSAKNFGRQNNAKMTADIVVALSLTYNINDARRYWTVRSDSEWLTDVV